mgnify:CR=1 FL=1
MKGLMLHCGAKPADLVQLQEAPTPEPTRSYCPIPFHEIREMLLDEIALQLPEHEVASEAHGLSRGAKRWFGTVQLRHEHPAMGLNIGARSSHDQSLPVALAAGAWVFVCDNMMFESDGVMVKRKHTTHAYEDVRAMIKATVSSAQARFDQIERQVEAMQRLELSEGMGYMMLGLAYGQRALSTRQMTVATEEWQSPPEHFAERNAWNWYNAVTESLKHGEAGNMLKAHVQAHEWTVRNFDALGVR